MFGPIISIGRAINTASTIYVVGKIGLRAFQEVRKMQGEKLRADEIRSRFIQSYKANNDGADPEESLVKSVLGAANAVDHPIRQRINEAWDDAGDKVNQCVEAVKDVFKVPAKTDASEEE